MQARLIKGIQKPRPEFETVGACLIMLHGISDTGANFECWYVEFLPRASGAASGSKHECRKILAPVEPEKYTLSSSLIIESDGARTVTF